MSKYTVSRSKRFLAGPEQRIPTRAHSTQFRAWMSCRCETRPRARAANKAMHTRRCDVVCYDSLVDR